MTAGTDTSNHAVLTPDEAISVLGNVILLGLIQTLGAVDTALSFTIDGDSITLTVDEHFDVDEVVE